MEAVPPYFILGVGNWLPRLEILDNDFNKALNTNWNIPINYVTFSNSATYYNTPFGTRSSLRGVLFTIGHSNVYVVQIYLDGENNIAKKRFMANKVWTSWSDL